MTENKVLYLHRGTRHRLTVEERSELLRLGNMFVNHCVYENIDRFSYRNGISSPKKNRREFWKRHARMSRDELIDSILFFQKADAYRWDLQKLYEEMCNGTK